MYIIIKLKVIFSFLYIYNLYFCIRSYGIFELIVIKINNVLIKCIKPVVYINVLDMKLK